MQLEYVIDDVQRVLERVIYAAHRAYWTSLHTLQVLLAVLNKLRYAWAWLIAKEAIDVEVCGRLQRRHGELSSRHCPPRMRSSPLGE